MSKEELMKEIDGWMLIMCGYMKLKRLAPDDEFYQRKCSEASEELEQLIRPYLGMFSIDDLLELNFRKDAILKGYAY